ncbi:MAG: hypothetical protein WAN65_27340 [Candidatus Sulfotelmatobacter sp.]
MPSSAHGNFADLTTFDSKKRWTFETAKSRSLSHNTPFDGWQFTGKVVAVVGGRVVYRGESKAQWNMLPTSVLDRQNLGI